MNRSLPADAHPVLPLTGGAVAVPPPPSVGWSTQLKRAALALTLVVILVWSYFGAEIRPLELVTNLDKMGEYARGFLTPDFTDWPDFLNQMGVTLQIAVWGTFLAVVLAIPCGLLCASNLFPRWVHHPVRRVMDAFRAINELIFALLFISAIGLGPFAGVLALAVHTLGTLAKLFSEAVEAIDPGPVEGIRATGAGRADEINYGVLPQVMPLWISYTLYRFEANVRSATIIGIVGAGGIGFLLKDAIDAFQYGRTSAMLIIIIVTVVLLDIGSGAIRKRFI